MDLLVRLFLRLGVLFEMPGSRPLLRPVPVPVRKHPSHPGAPR